jgi:lipopolysaccharide export system permease protein
LRKEAQDAMKILHRYILSQLIPVFLLALVAFTCIFVLFGLVHNATQQGLNLVQVLCIVPFVIPASLPYAIPATLLLSVTIVYGRLAADNEITATKAAGINVLHLLVPALLLGIGLSLFTLFLYNRIIPMANLRMRTLLVNNVEDMVYAVLRRDHVLKTSGGMGYEIHVERVEGKKLFSTTFKRRTPEGTYNLTVFAQEATLEFDLQNRVVKVRMFNAEGTDGEVYFEVEREKVIEVGLPSMGQITPGFRDMTMRELEERKAEVRRLQETDCARWAFKSLGSISSGHFGQVPWGSLDGLSRRGNDAQRDIWRLNLEPHMRGAIAFGCLAFVLLGCPVAILFQRGDPLSAFISCFLPIIVIYYPLMMFGYNFSKEGVTPPIVVWGANLMVAVLSFLAFRPVLRH